MVAIIEGIISAILGLAVLLYDYRAWCTGTIRTGHPPRGASHHHSKYVVKRSESPVWFMIAVVFYAVAGIWLIVHSLLVLTGNADSILSGVLSFIKH